MVKVLYGYEEELKEAVIVLLRYEKGDSTESHTV